MEPHDDLLVETAHMPVMDAVMVHFQAFANFLFFSVATYGYLLLLLFYLNSLDFRRTVDLYQPSNHLSLLLVTPHQVVYKSHFVPYDCLNITL